MSYLPYLYLFTCSVVQHILCCVFTLFVLVLYDRRRGDPISGLTPSHAQDQGYRPLSVQRTGLRRFLVLYFRLYCINPYLIMVDKK
jgi:hypothetical protein